MCLILSKSTTGVCVLSVIIICCFFVNVLKLVRQGFFFINFPFFCVGEKRIYQYAGFDFRWILFFVVSKPVLFWSLFGVTVLQR